MNAVFMERAMKKVIVFGSMNMDMTVESDRIPKKGETIDGWGIFTNTGGKGANQAVAAAKLGAETFLIGMVGDDAFGNTVLAKLAQYGVDCSFVRRSSTRATGTAVVLRCEGDNRIILGAGANHEMKIDAVRHALESIAVPEDIFLTQFECDYETTLEAIRLAKQMGLYTVLNPAPAKKIPEDIFPCVDLLVMNQTECEFLSGGNPQDESECEKAVRFFQGKGVKSVIITLGPGGSITVDGGAARHIRSYKVPKVDTTAAGDCYIGALASAMVHDRNLVENMVFATQAAALTITKRGAQQSIPYKNEVDEYYKEERDYE